MDAQMQNDANLDADLAGEGAWTIVERGPTRNVGYALGCTALLIPLLAFAARAFAGKPPFEFAAAAGTAKYLAAVIAFVVLSQIWTNSWVLKYNNRRISLSHIFSRFIGASAYKIDSIFSIEPIFSGRTTLFGIPFDNISIQFEERSLALATSDWKHHSLKQLICDLFTYRPDLPRDPKLLAYIAGEYDRDFNITAED